MSVSAVAARLPRGARAWLEDAAGGPARLRVVLLLAAVLALNGADIATIGAVAGPLQADLGIGATQLGLLVTVSTAIGAVATLPAGALTDHVNRVRLMAVALVVWSIALAVSGASVDYTMLLITRLALGAGVAVAGPVVASLTGDLFPAADRGRVYGFILAGELVGAGFGFAISGQVAAAASWRVAFWVLAVPGFLVAFLLVRKLPEPGRGGVSQLRRGAVAFTDTHAPVDDPQVGAAADQVGQDVEEAGIEARPEQVLHEDPTNRSLWWTVRYVLAGRTNRLLIASSALGYFFFTGVETFAVVLLEARFGLGTGTASLLIVVIGAGAVIGVLATGRLSDWLLQRRDISARPIVAGVCFLISVGTFVPGLLVRSLPIAVVLLFVGAAGLGGANAPLDAARLDVVVPELWGRAEAVRTVFRSSVESVAPLLFGYVATLLGAAGTSGTAAGGHGGEALDRTFLIMLAPVLVAGLLAVLRARSVYPRDVATALVSEQKVVEQRESS